MTGRRPDFDFDLAYGEAGEQLARQFCERWIGGNTKVETKRKRLADPWFYVETEHDPGRTGVFKPSGLTTTAADLWAFAIEDTRIVLFVPTLILRLAVEREWGTPRQETDGSCPTRGRLLGFHELVEVDSPLARKFWKQEPRCRHCNRPMLLGQNTSNHGAHFACSNAESS